LSKIEFNSIDEIRLRAFEVLKEKGLERAENYCDIRSGAETGASFRRSRQALDELYLRTRLIHGVNSVDTTTTILGTKINTPVLTAPIAGTAVPGKAYASVVKACVRAGTMCIVGYPQSKEAIKSFANIKDKKMGWIIKPLKDMAELKSCYEMAEEVGCVVTGMDLDSAAGLHSGYIPGLMDKLAKAYWSFKTVDELKAIRDLTSLPFIVKGIMCVEDAEKCVEAGVDAIIVSNHAGYALDYAEAPIEVLPEIVDAVGRKVDVLMDGGIRHGTDILKALAFGAKAVLIGRPTVWGFNAGGEEGMVRLIELLTNELVRAMKLTGVSDIKDVPAGILV
jgi:isopentenyl diphosphate isomerase/L-lactate dehydrogenase-like FMN-dependent dehydrogenase